MHQSPAASRSRQLLLALPHPRLIALPAWIRGRYNAAALPTILLPAASTVPLFTLRHHIPYQLALGRVVSAFVHDHLARPTAFRIFHLLEPHQLQDIAADLSRFVPTPPSQGTLSELPPEEMGPFLHLLASHTPRPLLKKAAFSSLRWFDSTTVPDYTVPRLPFVDRLRLRARLRRVEVECITNARGF